MTKKKQHVPLQKLHAWHHAKHGYMLFGVVELVLSYVFFSWAIDNGQLWTYLIGIVLFIGAIQNFFRLLQKLFKRN